MVNLSLCEEAHRGVCSGIKELGEKKQARGHLQLGL